MCEQFLSLITSCLASLSYSLILDCWKTNRDERPSFQELVKSLEELMLQEVDYFDFNNVDESKDYYQVQESKTEETSDDGNDDLNTFI